MHGGENIEIKGSGIEVGLAGAPRLAEATEIERQDTETVINENARLFLPTSFGELPAVREHDAAAACTVEVGVEQTAILCGKGDVLLGSYETGGEKRSEQRAEHGHFRVA